MTQAEEQRTRETLADRIEDMTALDQFDLLPRRIQNKYETDWPKSALDEGDIYELAHELREGKRLEGLQIRLAESWQCYIESADLYANHREELIDGLMDQIGD